MKKGEITLKILEVISNTVKTSADIIDVILSSGYGASYAKLDYEFRKRERKRSEGEIRKQRIQNYYNTLYKLKKDNLIITKTKNKKTFLAITSAGREKIKNLKQQTQKNKTIPGKYYPKEAASNFTIVVFDIPEKERRKRDWLRETLSNIGFSMIQKSVWIGKVKIPKEFLNDIFKLKIESCVEIFEINKTGSLKQIN